MMKIGTLFAALKKRKTYGKKVKVQKFLTPQSKIVQKVGDIKKKPKSALTLRSKYN